VGEGCHFVDLACWLVGAPPASVNALLHPLADEALQTAQRFTVSMAFDDGSLATILYSDRGSRRLPKEYVEAHAGGRSALIDDFRRLTLLEEGKGRKVGSRTQDKGHWAQLGALRAALDGSASIGLDPLDSMEAVFAAMRSAELGRAQPGASR
jgi:polar amino acid transport system substrate-binding protein